MFPCTFSLVNCDLRFVDFISLRLQKSIFLSCRFRDCLFEETDLRKSDFTGSEFNNTEFRHSDLSHCDFSMTEGLDINPEINRILSIKIPQEAGLKILKRMGVVVGDEVSRPAGCPDGPSSEPDLRNYRIRLPTDQCPHTYFRKNGTLTEFSISMGIPAF